MDDSEKLAEQYLRTLDYADVRYEPDGNIPPDFSLDGVVGVEVRRLNQSHDDGSGARRKGLEEQAIPLWRRMRGYLEGLGLAPEGRASWYVFYRFGRPIPDWKQLKKRLDSILLPFMAEIDPQPFSKDLGDGFSIRVFRSPSPKPTFFRAAGVSDEQSGGWLLAEMEANLTHYIAEKARKIEPFRAAYREWWLVLDDQIGYGLDKFDQDMFHDQVKVSPGPFSRIVLLDPKNGANAFNVFG